MEQVPKTQENQELQNLFFKHNIGKNLRGPILQWVQESDSTSIAGCPELEKGQKDDFLKFILNHKTSTSPVMEMLDSEPDPNNEDQFIQNINQDFSSMPPCFERSIMALIYYFSLKLQEMNPQRKIEEEIRQNLELLKVRANIEKEESAEVLQAIERIEVDVQRSLWKEAKQEANKILKKIRRLDLQEIFRLYGKTEEAATLIKDQEVILFLGPTGSGKSTLIHFLGGSKMKETKVDGLNHIAPDVIVNPALKTVRTSPHAKSETRYINPIQVNGRDLGGALNQPIVLCDSPGFGDTAGPEVDIANGLGLLKAIRGCRQVKPVVLISYTMRDERMKPVKNLARLLVGMIPKIEDHMRSFSFLYTQYPEKEKSTIFDSLMDVISHFTPEESSNPALLFFFNDMLKKAKKATNANSPLAIDPIRDSADELFQELIASASISRPGDVFQFSITEKSKDAIRHQAQNHERQIISGADRAEYEFIGYKLDELKNLSELLDENSLKEIYDRCIQHVTRQITERQEKVIAALNRCLTPQNTLTQEDVQQYLTCINQSLEADRLRERHLGKKVPCSDFLVKNLSTHLKDLLSEIRKKNLEDESIKENLEKLKLISSSFPVAVPIYRESREFIREKWNYLIDSYKNCVNSHEFDKCAEYIAKIYKAQDLLGEEYLIHPKEEYQSLQEFLIQNLKKCTEKLNPLWKREKIGLDDIKPLQNCLSILASAKSTVALQPYIPKQNEINKLYDDIIEWISSIFEKRKREIDTFMKNSDLQAAEQPFKEMELIRTISDMEGKIADSYYSTLEKLCGLVQQSRREIEVMMSSLFRKDPNYSYEKLATRLSNMRDTKWIAAFREGIYENSLKEIEDQIIQHATKMAQFVKEINLGLEDFDQIEKSYQNITDLHAMQCLSQMIPGLTSYITESEAWFKRTIQEMLDIIGKAYNSEKLNQGFHILEAQKTEITLLYLDKCKKIPIVVAAATETKTTLEQYIKRYNEQVQKEMNDWFTSIIYCQDKLKIEEIYKKAKSLQDRLREISEYQEKYPKIWSCFSETILNLWRDKLSEEYRELSHELGQCQVTHKIEGVEMKLAIARALSQLDRFMGDGKFFTLYREVQNVFFTQVGDEARTIIEAIKNHDYSTVAFEMTTLQLSTVAGHHLQSIKRALNAGMQTLIAETRNQAIMLDLDVVRVQSLVGNLNKLKQADQFVSQDVELPKTIDGELKDIISLITERITYFVKKIQALITVSNFEEADKKMDAIKAVRNILGPFCSEKMNQEIEKLDESHNASVDKVVKKYSEMNLDRFALNPPNDIFEKFGKVNNTNSVYAHAMSSLRENIYAKVREKIQAAKEVKPLNPENEETRIIESAVKYLPKDMKNHLESELRYCKEDITKKIRNNEEDLKKVLSSRDPKSIRKIIEDYQSKPEMHASIGQIKDFVLRQMEGIQSIVLQHLEKDEMKEALQEVNKMIAYKRELESLIGELVYLYNEVKARILKKLREFHLSFLNGFTDPKITSISVKKAEDMENKFAALVEFINYASDNQNGMFSKDDYAKISEIDKKVEEYFKGNGEKYEEALKGNHITSLNHSLEVMSKWGKLFLDIKQYTEKYSENEVTVKELRNVLSHIKDHQSMVEEISNKITNLKDELVTEKLLNDRTKGYEKNRDEFYIHLNEKLSFIRQLPVLTVHIPKIGGVTLEEIGQQCFEAINREIMSIAFQAETRTKTTLYTSKAECEQFNTSYCNLMSFHRNVRAIDGGVKEKIDNIDHILIKIVTELGTIIHETYPRLENVADSLIKMKFLSNNINSFKARIDERIDQALENYKLKNGGGIALAKLGTILNHDKTGVGQSIINEHKCFEGYSLSLFNQKTARHNINYVIENIEGTSLNKRKLEQRYQEFDNKYKELIGQYLHPNPKLDLLISDTWVVGNHNSDEGIDVVWDAVTRNKVPILMAHISALWTLQNATHFFEAKDLHDQKSYLLQPHPAQVISIFRMLGIGDDDERLQNNLVQIGTGEGKSVTLAVTACVLALLGFDVSCACYSIYLSQRDCKNFQPLFDSLNLQKYIHYGTFNKLCEDVINQNGDVRKVVEELISTGTNLAVVNNSKPKRTKLLLVDEVDVFFSKEFFGNLYTPSASLSDPTITELINYIWTSRTSRLDFNRVKNIDQFMACCKKFPGWENLIEEGTKNMLADVRTFASHGYEIYNDKIVYPEKEQGNIAYNVRYGYKTLFAYFLEHEKGKITRSSLDENINLEIKLGSSSYAEIPQKFAFIMGVTGTLKTLSEPEIEMIRKNYNILKYTYSPSVFGRNNLTFIPNADVKIENEADYHISLAKEINDRLSGKNPGTKRAVLVFFESKAKLKEFEKSPALASICDKVWTLTEEASVQEKEDLIKKATASESIALLTRTFGRGTDFVCRDEVVNSNGGVHVIQTFLSEEVSEETQIKGRTARQGEIGSYSLVLLNQSLESFLIPKNELENVKQKKGAFEKFMNKLSSTAGLKSKYYATVYDFIHERRVQFFKAGYIESQKYVEIARKKHTLSEEFQTNLNNGNTAAVKEFLITQNKGILGELNSRTICLMDATGSMSNLLQKAKNTVGMMFERAHAVLKENKHPEDCFQIQLCMYRNYNDREDNILQSSPWETKPDNLFAFMNKIKATGGFGAYINEAIELGLWYANQENTRERISQVILIGDAPANTREHVNKGRKCLGENYWNTTKFGASTYYEDEVNKLRNSQIPVHAFFVDQDAETNFKQIAGATGGRCEALDINSPAGANMLTAFITKAILRNVGGQANGNILAEAYDTKYGKSYS